MGLVGRIWKCVKKAFSCGHHGYSNLLNDDNKALDLELTEISTFDLPTYQKARTHRLNCIETRFQREKARMKAENEARRMEYQREIDFADLESESDDEEFCVILEDRAW